MEPVRTCLGCRQRAPRSSLVRVVAIDGSVVVDALARFPGRGAWVHGTRDCVETATVRRAWARALRVAGPLDADSVLATISSSEEKADRHMDN
ncbi:YlxR family protein [Microcella sp.]|uniref:YlxR family protein n=1 Tax=Microcella sp. TaxID=1913979 RepID=UPI00299F80CC|nr:YlxR family protein [Microcella sp.]MDX2025446.1 YlxR family protein [Microcella sp.]